VFLQDVNNQKNYQDYYSDMRMIGKHFKIRSLANLDVWRHYTICNAMEPEFYTAINKALKNNDGKSMNYFIDKGDVKSDTMNFTLKNYNREKGLSFRFFQNNQSDTFEV